MGILITRPTMLKHFDTIYGDVGPPITPAGTPSISNSVTKFGGGSLYLPGSLSYLSMQGDTTFNFGLSDFTIEWWEYRTSNVNQAGSLHMGISPGGYYAALLFGYNNSGTMQLYMSSNQTSWNIVNGLSLGAQTLNDWVHWEFGRAAGIFYAFKNGTLVQTISSATTWSINIDSSMPTNIGRYGASYSVIGYIDEFVVTKGLCKHTTNFTPNTEPYEIVEETFPGYNNVSVNEGVRIANKNSGIKSETIVVNKELTTRQGKLTNYLLSDGANRDLRTHTGYILAKVDSSDRNVRTMVGQFLHTVNMNGERAIIPKQGTHLKTYSFTSNALSEVSFKVTPTFTYNGSTINVQATNNAHSLGKYALYVNNVLVLPYGEVDKDISNISFNVPINSLSIGSNNCKLFYMVSDSTYYASFVITSEAIDRQISERTIYSYTGGFDISPTINWYRKKDENFYSLYKPSQTGILKTTTVNNINLEKTGGILGVNIVGEGCLFLVSFDNQQTWLTFKNSIWETCATEDVSTQGMTEDQLSAITYEQWITVYQKTQLDFLVYMESGPEEILADQSINFYRSYGGGAYGGYSGSGSMPDTGVYEITRQHLYFGYYHLYDAGSTNGTLTINRFNKSLNVNEVTSFSYVNAGHGGLKTIELDLPFNPLYRYGSGSYSYSGAWQGSSYIDCQSNCYGFKNPYLTSITVLLPPNFPSQLSNIQLSPTITHGDSTLTAHIKDIENDIAYYRILVNGQVLQDWTTQGTEYDISIVIPSSITIVGTSAIEIQTYDGVTYGEPYITYLTKTNSLPQISGILDKLNLTALISDGDEKDTIRYRILLNGKVVKDWSTYIPQPVSIAYNINQSDVIIDYQNILTLEVQDNLGEVTSFDFDFVGQNYQAKGKYVFIL